MTSLLESAKYIPAPGIPMSGYIPTNLPAPAKFGGALLGGLAAATAAVELIGWLGGSKFRDDQLAKIKGKEPNAGYRDGNPPFEGGQSIGVIYRVALKMTYSDAPTRYYLAGGGMGTESPISDSDVRIGGIPVQGAFSGELTTSQNNSISLSAYYKGSNFGNLMYVFGANPKVSVYKVVRADGETDTGGNPPSTEPRSPAGNTSSQSNTDNQPRIVPPNLSPALGWGNGKGLASNAALPGLGIGSKSPDYGSGFAPTIPPVDPSKPPQRQPPQTQPPPQTTPSRPPTTKPSEDNKKSPISPLNPSELGNINQKLFEIGSILGVISSNTTPEMQQLNSKTGSCQAMNSPSCTQGMEGRIKDPLSAKLDAAQVARDTNAAAQSAALTGIAVEQQAQKGILATIAAKATDIFNLIGRLWNNSLIDKAMQYITMITVIHNAVMLTRGIADTLGSALDSGLQALGLQIQDKDGNQLGVTQIIGKSFENLIKGIIGNANYTALTETWIQSNRIYQTGVNLISNVQSIIDSSTAVAELTSNRLGTWMNAARNAGLVRENAYGAQSQNVTKFNAFQNKLENLEQGVSNVASITGNIVSVQQSVNELKSNRQEFENALKNKPQGTGLPENEPAKQDAATKKADSIYTIGDFSVVKPPEIP